MLTHLDLHRGVTHTTHTRRGDAVTRGPAHAERATATTADARGIAPGADADPARPRERMTLYLRESRDPWRQWTSLVAVAVHSVGERLRDGLPRHGGMGGGSD